MTYKAVGNSRASLEHGKNLENRVLRKKFVHFWDTTTKRVLTTFPMRQNHPGLSSPGLSKYRPEIFTYHYKNTWRPTQNVNNARRKPKTGIGHPKATGSRHYHMSFERKICYNLHLETCWAAKINFCIICVGPASGLTILGLCADNAKHGKQINRSAARWLPVAMPTWRHDPKLAKCNPVGRVNNFVTLTRVKNVSKTKKWPGAIGMPFRAKTCQKLSQTCQKHVFDTICWRLRSGARGVQMRVSTYQKMVGVKKCWYAPACQKSKSGFSWNVFVSKRVKNIYIVSKNVFVDASFAAQLPESTPNQSISFAKWSIWAIPRVKKRLITKFTRFLKECQNVSKRVSRVKKVSKFKACQQRVKNVSKTLQYVSKRVKK